ncbi:axonemal dynein light intermediate polypeptide 1-like isoform X1 [Syngnathoides biaculeatus]|uniref:axonemal dynein light intermediate polypeptide 1-like isoform X1 n=1 Tax=Syngnathoides biaculeatus TaxID=300417 RepID=UPI002ADE3E8E|nr:axonemal dynein light intermediate polypeptide 1-like isoform X1 [Syngnathoides biaculeatus]
MFEPPETLLKYENPVLISKTTDKKCSKGGRPFKVSTQPHADSPVPPPPKAKSSAAEAPRQQNDDILNLIFPPREWMEGNQLFVQQVSSAPCTRADVVNLEEHLDRKLQQRRAIETGICPVRRELYTQCFDELIRQVTINCAERGHLLLRVRDEIQMTIAAYQTFYESSVVFGMRKALQAEQDKVDMEKRPLILTRVGVLEPISDVIGKRRAGLPCWSSRKRSCRKSCAKRRPNAKPSRRPKRKNTKCRRRSTRNRFSSSRGPTSSLRPSWRGL